MDRLIHGDPTSRHVISSLIGRVFREAGIHTLEGIATSVEERQLVGCNVWWATALVQWCTRHGYMFTRPPLLATSDAFLPLWSIREARAPDVWDILRQSGLHVRGELAMVGDATNSLAALGLDIMIPPSKADADTAQTATGLVVPECG
jgi:hypothetical protein